MPDGGSKAPSSKKPTALVFSRGAGYLASAVGGLVVARRLGPESYGVLATATGVIGAVLVLGPLGIDQLFLRGDLTEGHLRRALRFVVVISVCLLLIAAFVWPSLSWTTRTCVLFFGFTMIVNLSLQPWLLVPQRALDFPRQAGRELTMRLVSSASIVLAVFLIRSPVAVSAANLIASLILVPVALAHRNKSLYQDQEPSVERPSSATWRLVQTGLPFAVSGAFYTLYFSIDMALLGTIRGPSVTGTYQAAYSFVSAAVVLPVVLNNDILRPRLYSAQRHDEDAGPAVRRFGLMSGLSGAVVSAAFLVAGPNLVVAFFGGAYRPAGLLLQILGAAILPHYLNSWMGNILVARDRVRSVLAVQAALAVINVVGNVSVIPAHGARGAAAMTVVTELLGTLCYLLLFLRIARMRKIRSSAS